MTAFYDLKPGLYRARWINVHFVGLSCYLAHRFDIVGVGLVSVPILYVNPGQATAIDCNMQLSLEVTPALERVSPNGHRYLVQRVNVKAVPA